MYLEFAILLEFSIVNKEIKEKISKIENISEFLHHRNGYLQLG